MADIQLPGFNGVQAPGPMPSVDPSAAAAPWKGLASIGNAVENIGDQALQRQAALENKIKDAATQKTVSDMTLDVSRGISDYKAKITQNPGDPSKWGEDYQKAVEPMRQKWLSDPNLSDLQRTQLTTHFNNIVGSEANSITASAAIATVTQAKTAAGNLIEEGERTGNDLIRQQGFAQLKGIIPEPELQKVIAKSDHNTALNRINLDIESNPQVWAEKLADPDAATKLGIAVDDIPRLQGRQQEAEHKVMIGTITKAKDQIAANPNLQPDDLERNFGNTLSPSVMANLQDDLRQRDNYALKAQRATPEYKAQTIGQATAMIAAYKMTDAGYDTQHAQIESLIRTLPEGSAEREELTDTLRRAQSDQQGQVKDKKQIAYEAIVDAYKGGKFGDVSQPSQDQEFLGKLTADGLLRDPNKLQQGGLRTDQAEAVMTLDKEKLKAQLTAVMSPDEAELQATALSKNKTEANRTTAFRLLYGHRLGDDQYVSPFDKAAFEAIAAGRGSDTKITAPNAEKLNASISAKMDAQAKMGGAKMKLTEFLQSNPDATAKDIDEKVFEISGEHMRVSLSTNKLGAPPAVGDQGAPIGDPIPIRGSLVDTVKEAEGFNPQAYWDHGQWSIGYGTKSEKGQTIDRAGAETALKGELSKHAARVDSIAAQGGYDFAPHERDALTSFDYNTGDLEQLLLRSGKRSKDQIMQALPKYVNAADTGAPLPGLVRRRDAELRLFQNGYPPVR